jgi:hypothetical protein
VLARDRVCVGQVSLLGPVSGGPSGSDECAFRQSKLSVPFPADSCNSRRVGWIGKSDLLVSEEFGSA